ncbi:MAG: DUF1573 domain-containing protein [bacterium]
MKSFRLLCGAGIIWIFSVVILCAQNTLKPPRIICEEPVFDFGSSAASTNQIHKFTLRNDGGTPLMIESVRACCGAVANLLDKVVQPGSSTVLTVNLSLKGRRGPVSKTIYVQSNDPREPYFQLKLTGNVLINESPPSAPIVRAVPDKVDFGVIRDDADVVQLVTVCGPSNASFRIANMSSSVRWCRVSPKENGNGRVIEIRTMPPLPAGHINANVTVESESPVSKSTIPVTASVFGDFQVVPSEIVLLGNAVPSQPVTRYASLRSRSGKAFKILKVQTPDPEIVTYVESLGVDGYRIKLDNLRPNIILNGKEIIVYIDGETNRSFTIPFQVMKSGD